ncbi:BA75_04805T0 [Komagataella pastoris]|uniref:BA75_04805T0 n=1 Tax=Komagataella pastoris TaxID=4922 RepID=A0A1B2JHX0_PICPA|nr:BA75_04805T0 [Komagataella pastoris]
MDYLHSLYNSPIVPLAYTFYNSTIIRLVFQYTPKLRNWVSYHIASFNSLLHSKLTYHAPNLVAHPASLVITFLFVYLFILLIIHELVLHLGVKLNWWQKPGSEFFIETPVHCAHIYVDLHIIEKHEVADPKLEKLTIQEKFYKLQSKNSTKYGSFIFHKLKYHLEFGPNDYDPRNPDLGTTLGFSRAKTLKLFKDSKVYTDDLNEIPLSPEELILVHRKKELTPDLDDKFLCELDVETGNKIDAFVVI